jgi:hypothetical protein
MNLPPPPPQPPLMFCMNCNKHYSTHTMQGKCVQNRSGRNEIIAWLIGVVIVFVLLLSGIAFFNPNVNIPVISPIACSIKGGTWDNGQFLTMPGCYAPATN